MQKELKNQLNKTEVIAFISNTPDGIDWKRVVLTTVENVGKLKGGSALLYDPDRVTSRAWLNAEKHFMLYNMYSKRKLKEHAKLNGDRQKMSHQLWQLINPHAVKPAEKDMTQAVIQTPEKKLKVKNKAPVKVQSVVNDVNRAQIEIGSMESKKHNLLHHVSMLQEQLNKMQVDFEKTYGTADINIQDGTINHKEDVKTD